MFMAEGSIVNKKAAITNMAPSEKGKTLHENPTKKTKNAGRSRKSMLVLDSDINKKVPVNKRKLAQKKSKKEKLQSQNTADLLKLQMLEEAFISDEDIRSRNRILRIEAEKTLEVGKLLGLTGDMDDEDITKKLMAMEKDEDAKAGDFNSVLSEEERVGTSDCSKSINDFNVFVQGSELVDLPLIGRKYTWYRRNNFPAMSRLDRFPLSMNWLSTFTSVNQ
ncbi:uncharacterized protein LOC111318680 [Durio zibethinus]|uniref:Uncharacterized protein LOC111318680 n=1 Tax=Durio zibethinus TaxID=66656 RepID=A0A6P6BJI9_DURZI|nr:uncharacterized protein LOC111318680 [Durio zibethinus]